MSGSTFDPAGSDSSGPAGQPGPVIRDRRRLDPETGQVRGRHEAGAPDDGARNGGAPDSGAPDDGALNGGAPDDAAGAAEEPGEAGETLIQPVGPDGRTDPLEDDLVTGDPVGTGGAEAVSLDGILADLDAAQASAAERLSDLQRLQAEFVNYRRRVDRDRDVSRDQAVAGVLEALLPVLDDVHLARQHGDLEGGPFAAIAEKLETVLERFGLSRYGEQGEAFDPSVHEALMHTEADLPDGATTTTVVQVLQPGYRTGERVLRAARVAVADPH